MKEENKIIGLIDNLARSVKNGFERIDGQFEDMKKDIAGVKDSVANMDKKFDILEGKIAGNHERRIEILEDKMIQARTILKVK